ncbi:hypothetical protein QA601_17230 [Chitinispirillales bacterium ANBcel5]|uniref:hypothetical protein n=1 Tax=Cellulosispirillum alkaliphilum TaxID=3039283 RepID=UPI002A4F8E73|nr:hypothetical protein [Chitinispirillales bacterium ANBcel5]
MKYRFEGDNIPPIENPQTGEMLALLDTLHPKSRCFFSLTEIHTGSYVQVAGARLRLTVEARQYAQNGFRHYVMGDYPRKEDSAYINCRVGPIYVLQSQMLVLDDARRIFVQFLNNAKLIEGFDLQDVTSRFLPG